MVLSTNILLALLPFFLSVNAQASGNGKTTRYWDCCKPSCSWTKKISLATGATPVLSCDANDSPILNADAKSGCDGGVAYMCSDQNPWAVSEDLAYGFAAASISGGNEASTCCACFELTFTSGPVMGKKFIVQSTNSGGDLGENHFDLAMPGGGFGIFNGCTAQFGTPASTWGQQYGGIATRAQCDGLPAKVRAGCYWRFDWFKNADNPTMSFKQVTCPAALTAKSGCVRQGEIPTGPATVPSWTGGASAPTSSTGSKPTTVPGGAATTTKNSTSAAAPTGAAPGGGSSGEAQLFAQCGGIGWAGPTVCVAGATCKPSGVYYSQCVQ